MHIHSSLTRSTPKGCLMIDAESNLMALYLLFHSRFGMIGRYIGIGCVISSLSRRIVAIRGCWKEKVDICLVRRDWGLLCVAEVSLPHSTPTGAQPLGTRRDRSQLAERRRQERCRPTDLLQGWRPSAVPQIRGYRWM